MIRNQISFSRALLAYIAVSFFLIFDMAVQVSPSVMANYLMNDLALTTFALGIMSGIYFYTYTLMQIPSGLLFDRFNPQIIISYSLLICIAGTFLFGATHNIYMGSLARLLMGLGSACAFVSVLVVTADVFPERYFAFFAGVTQMIAALGAMMGQMPVSLLVSMMGWRHTMFLLGSIGIGVLIFIHFFLRYERQHPVTKTEDIQKYQHPIAHILSDLREIFKNKQTWYIALYACLTWAPMSGFTSLWGVPFLSQFDHLTPDAAAFYCSLMWLGLIIASPLVGLWSTHVYDRVKPLVVLAFVGAVAFFFVLKQPLSGRWLGLALFVAGAACGGQGLSFVLAKDNQLPRLSSTALGFNNMAVVISGAIFQPLMGKVISLSGVNNYRHGSFLILFCYIFAVLVSLIAIKNPSKSEGVA